MKLSHILVTFSSALLLLSCSDKKKTDKKEEDTYKEKRETATPDKQAVEVPVMLDNKGIGPVKSVTFEETINQELAEKGAQLFQAKCTACHKADQRFIGPSMVGIYQKRSPEWVMNMIMNPDEMLKKDPVAMALLKEYNNTVMLNQNIPEEEARAMAEWFRTLK